MFPNLRSNSHTGSVSPCFCLLRISDGWSYRTPPLPQKATGRLPLRRKNRPAKCTGNNAETQGKITLWTAPRLLALTQVLPKIPFPSQQIDLIVEAWNPRQDCITWHQTPVSRNRLGEHIIKLCDIKNTRNHQPLSNPMHKKRAYNSHFR